MRERLVAGFVGLAVLVLLMFGVFRAYSVGDLVREEEQQKADRSVVLIAQLVGQRQASGEPVDAAYLQGLVNDGERLVLAGPGGSRVSAGAAVDAADDSTIRASRRVAGNASGGTVTLLRSGDLVDDRIADQILPLVLLAISMVAVAAVLGYLAAVRLSRPFRELASFAGQLGRGRFDLDIPRYAMPEAQQIGTAMRDGSRRLDEMVRREREFAANASHQLRTPITALRLELEDLSLWPETAGPVARQLERAVVEVDRLSSTVDDLLHLARGRRIMGLVDIDLAALVDDVVGRWQPAAHSRSRVIGYDAPGVVAVRLPAGPVSQILDVLMDNAVKHGVGRITVDIAEPDHYVRVRVSDEGRRTFGIDIFKRQLQGPTSPGPGIGLSVASEMAEAIGGHLTLEPDPSTSFSLILPKAPEAS